MFSDIKSVHFVGIGGTAMASPAAALRQRGFAVTGSDQNVYPPMSTFLAASRIKLINRCLVDRLTIAERGKSAVDLSL